jgi:hypothetical protein
MTSAQHVCGLLAASLVAATVSAQAPAAPVAQAPTICGNQPLCYEAPDFAATITDFRTSSQGRIIDVAVRFTNKTNQVLFLGYTNGSGVATDERGNRYVVWGGNGVRGMGLVNGQSLGDPKFQINPAGYGDTRFELGLQGYPPVIGFTFELDLSVNEINAYQGNQFTVGNEFPLMWKGLANGAAGAAPGAIAYAGNGAASGTAGTLTSIPCQNSTVQNVASGANNAAANVSAAVSSIGSLFRKKQQPQAAGSTSGPTVPCTQPQDAASTATGVTGATGATTTTTSTGAVVTRPTTATATTAKPVTPAPAAKPQAALTSRPTTAAKPQAAVAPAPAKKVTPPVTTQPAQPANTPPAQAKP